MDPENKPKNTPIKTTNILMYALVGAFAIAALLTAYLTFIAVRDFVTSWEMTDLPGIAIDITPTPSTEEGVLTNAETPLQSAEGPTPQPWDGASRVTLLVMGLDYRDWQAGEGPPRTDTMILFTIDPLAQTAGMLSVPRDLWVSIPGFSYGKINTAYQLGEAYELPGGGPELAMKTMAEFIGVPIDYYAQVDFGAFIKFIDEIGGVKLDVTEPITVDLLGDDTFKKLKPGRQVLTGEIALAYARARKTEGGDFDRAQRQQQVIMAIRDRMIDFDLLPMLISKAPTLYEDLSSGIHTNLTLDQVIRLAWLAQQIPEGNIKNGIIGTAHVNFVKTPDGMDALKPLPDQIRLLRDEIFTETGPVSPVAANMPAADLMKIEAARISVLNGSATSGLAAKTGDFLKEKGMNISEIGNAESLYNNTTIIDYTGKPYTIKFLLETMGINANYIYSRYDPTQQSDMALILGVDWGTTNPMP
ncbi:MAG: LCP family protein [Anaerolineales bacterium]|nr:LCP family protein [Anaerolineales bacterium]